MPYTLRPWGGSTALRRFDALLYVGSGFNGDADVDARYSIHYREKARFSCLQHFGLSVCPVRVGLDGRGMVELC